MQMADFMSGVNFLAISSHVCNCIFAIPWSSTSDLSNFTTYSKLIVAIINNDYCVPYRGFINYILNS
ncbi:hypothetical protein BV210_05125 [Halorientalis sp. IM1011]|nr:hypothetical protein BV210_05125 [Halorientalis sp. IM1011]